MLRSILREQEGDKYLYKVRMVLRVDGIKIPADDMREAETKAWMELSRYLDRGGYTLNTLILSKAARPGIIHK